MNRMENPLLQNIRITLFLDNKINNESFFLIFLQEQKPDIRYLQIFFFNFFYFFSENREPLLLMFPTADALAIK